MFQVSKVLADGKRFERKIRKARTGCWLWCGSKVKDGYGKMMMGSRSDGSRRLESAHRFAYKFYTGPIPPGMNVLHKCENRACANPDHLYAGTQSENVRDAIKHGRWKKQIASVRLNAFVGKGEKNPNSKLNLEQVHQIRALAAGGELTKNLAKKFGVCRVQIGSIIHNRSWAV